MVVLILMNKIKMIEDNIVEIISHYCGNDISKVTRDSSLSDNLGFDSLDQIECVMEIEEKLNVEFLDSDIDDMITVQDVIEFFYKRLNPKC